LHQNILLCIRNFELTNCPFNLDSGLLTTNKKVEKKWIDVLLLIGGTTFISWEEMIKDCTITEIVQWW
jgi:hypothetical protein